MGNGVTWGTRIADGPRGDSAPEAAGQCKPDDLPRWGAPRDCWTVRVGGWSQKVDQAPPSRGYRCVAGADDSENYGLSRMQRTETLVEVASLVARAGRQHSAYLMMLTGSAWWAPKVQQGRRGDASCSRAFGATQPSVPTSHWDRAKGLIR